MGKFGPVLNKGDYALSFFLKGSKLGIQFLSQQDRIHDTIQRVAPIKPNEVKKNEVQMNFS